MTSQACIVVAVLSVADHGICLLLSHLTFGLTLLTSQWISMDAKPPKNETNEANAMKVMDVSINSGWVSPHLFSQMLLIYKCDVLKIIPIPWSSKHRITLQGSLSLTPQQIPHVQPFISSFDLAHIVVESGSIIVVIPKQMNWNTELYRDLADALLTMTRLHLVLLDLFYEHMLCCRQKCLDGSKSQKSDLFMIIHWPLSSNFGVCCPTHSSHIYTVYK